MEELQTKLAAALKDIMSTTDLDECTSRQIRMWAEQKVCRMVYICISITNIYLMHLLVRIFSFHSFYLFLIFSNISIKQFCFAI